MRRNRLYSVLLALALCLTLLPTAALAVATTNDITGKGTESEPYLIYTAAGLKDFRNRVNGTGKYYGKADSTICAKLMNDIVLNDVTFGEDGTYTKGASGKDAEQWKPIGNDLVQYYTGTFDGGGHTIKGLYINSNQSNIGLFGIVENATIKNLTVTGYVKGRGSVGGIVGIVHAISSITIQNCVNYSTVTGESYSVGGIVGSCDGGIIQNCANLGSVNTASIYAGGIVGYAVNSTTMTACYNAGEVKGTRCVGGLLGYGPLNMTSCYNAGRVEGTNSTGGLVGKALWSEENNKYTFSNCYYLGTAATGVLGTVEHFTGDTSECSKTKTEFANGDVLELLKQGDSTAWADNCGYLAAANMTLPLLSGQTADAHKHTAETGNCMNGIYCVCGDLMYSATGGHNYPDKWTAVRPGSTHSKACQNPGCGVAKSESCSGGTATCTEQATCEVCHEKYGAFAPHDFTAERTDEKYRKSAATCTAAAVYYKSCAVCGEIGTDTFSSGDVDPNHHEDLTHVDAVAATTTAEGNIEYWYCPDCGKYFKDAAAKQEITQAQTVTAKLPGSTGGGGGSSSGSSYAVSVSETEHGSVTVSPKSARRGATVTVTVTPDKGYTLETLTVTDAGGKELTLTDKGNGKYTFTQPSSKVTVKAAFMDDNTMLNYFADVKSSDYYYDAVLWAAQKGITSGTDDVHFSPNTPCTRAQIVTFLWRAAGSPVVNYAMDLSDVSEDSYYAEAVRWALSEGITAGTAESTFSPNSECTRAQAVTFLCRSQKAAAAGGMAVREFKDFDSIPAYAVDAVQWALENQVTTGTGDGSFAPNASCTRAQIVTFLYRTYQGK